jgi:DNA-binding transcriptional MerR regulator/methanogenic corrinoid protein MtbC1
MNQRAPGPPWGLSIAAAERDTGLSKDTLRVWERRYGFPSPPRDDAGERVYTADQIEKLRILKRLIDVGHRPRQVVALPIDELQQLAEQQHPAVRRESSNRALPDLDHCLDCLRLHDVDGLRRHLRQAASRVGLAALVTELIAPLNTLVGDAWMRGRLEIFEEHLYTELVQSTLRHAIDALPGAPQTAGPRVLLTTCPGEPHGLGLLMAEAMLCLEGACCISLGVATPIWDIVLAVNALRCDVVALSFTGCMNPNHVVEALTELRTKLPARIDVWAGGAAPALHRRPLPGVKPLAAFGDLTSELQRWRAQQGARAHAPARP